MIIPVNSKYFGYVEVIIDDSDYPLLQNRSVFLSRTGYPKIKLNNKSIHIHRLFMGITDKKVIVDHIDRNPLNNRRINLRVVDDTQSSYNRAKRNGGKLLSKYKGVCKVSPRVNKGNPFLARIQISKEKRISLGYYENEKDAALAYNKAALFYFKEFAVLNDIDGDS